MTTDQIVTTDADAGQHADHQEDRYVVRPRLELEAPDDFAIPREFFAKRLINSPIDFGSLNCRQQMEPEGGGPSSMRFGRNWEIDIALHLHHGALICGFVSAREADDLSEKIERQAQILAESRKALIEALEASSSYYDDVPPIGLYIALYGADGDAVPDAWDAAEAWIGTETDADGLQREMTEAMKWWTSDADVDAARWPWLAVGLRELDGRYQSALELLVQYEEL